LHSLQFLYLLYKYNEIIRIIIDEIIIFLFLFKKVNKLLPNIIGTVIQGIHGIFNSILKENILI